MKVVRGEAQNYSWESAPAGALKVSALVDPMQVLFTPCSHVLLQSSSINFGTFLCDVTFSCLFLQFLDPPYAEPSPKFFVTD